MSAPRIKLTQAKEGAEQFGENEVPFGTFHNGRTILLEEPTWFFIIVILFFLSSGSAVALGIYGMYQWESGETYTTDGLDTATYVCSSFALVFLLIIIITYMVLSFKKSLRVDEDVLGEKFNSLHARFLASGAYKDIIKNYPNHARDMLIEDRQNLQNYLKTNFATSENKVKAEAKRRAGVQAQRNIAEFRGKSSGFLPETQISEGQNTLAGTVTTSPGGSRTLESPVSLSRPRRYNPPLKKKKPSPSSKRKSPSKKKSSSKRK